MQRVLTWLAVITSCGMFIVLVMGALVTNTGSGHGCSNTWPLCDGKVIPQLSISLQQGVFVEFSHRAVTAVESLLVFVLAAGTWMRYRRRREARWLVPTMIVFLLLQAVLGAIAAGIHETPEILALHFGVSLISFASIVLTAAFLFGARGGDARRDLPAPGVTRRLIWVTLIFTYVVVYLGAYVRHVGAMGACMDWPLCRGALVPPPGSSYDVMVQFTHRFAAGLLALLVLALWLSTWRIRSARPDLFWGGTAALASVLLQSAAGAILVFSGFSLVSELMHAAVVALLFASLCYLAFQLVPRRACLPRVASTAQAQAETARARAR